MNFRLSNTIILYPEKGKFFVYNFLLKRSIDISINEISLLRIFSEGRKDGKWIDEDCIYESFLIENEGSKNSFLKLVKAGVVIVEGSENDLLDLRYLSFWKWKFVTGSYHFSLKDTSFYSGDAEKKMAEAFEKKNNALGVEAPILYWENKNEYVNIQYFDKPTSDDEILNLMSRRRTIRKFDREMAISDKDLLNIIYSGLGITGFKTVDYGGTMPLKMTPSGGARNPYDAYVMCLNVTDIPRGLYHYSPTEHSFGLVKESLVVLPSEILGNQSWIDSAPAIIFLVANINRTMWKYEHHSGYKVMLIEAGHIAQNMILFAVSRGLNGSPTAAIHDGNFHKLIPLDKISQSCIYAIVLGYSLK